MSYDNPNRLTFMFPTFDFGAGADEVFAIVLPKGKKARLWDYGVQGVTEVMNGSSTTPKVAVGNSSDPDAYGDELDIDGVAADSGKTVRSTYREEEAGFATQMVARNIPADTTIYVTCTGAAGSPTGQGCPYVVLDVDN